MSPGAALGLGVSSAGRAPICRGAPPAGTARGNLPPLQALLAAGFAAGTALQALPLL